MSSLQPSHWAEVPHAPALGTLICPLEALPDGMATPWVMGAEAAPFRLLLLRSAGAVHAYVNRCAHFGVPLAAKPTQLIFQPHQSITCNVHYARYGWQDGACLSGECEGEGLLAVPVVIADGQLWVAEAAGGGRSG